MIRAEYIDHMGTDLSVVNSARVSFGKRKDKLDDKDKKLIEYLAKHKHFTPFESCVLTVKIDCPLYIRSQIHRHRTFSMNEISRRYTDENIRFYEPKVYRKQHKTSKQCSDGQFEEHQNESFKLLTENLHARCLATYNEMLSQGVARELARGILPQNLMTEFYMTGNLRNWVHFLGLRMDAHAQEEVRIIAGDVKNIILDKFPISAQKLLKYMK